MLSLTDTIVAPITGTQRAPVALIRVSGDKSWAIATAIFPSGGNEPRHQYFGKIMHQGTELDEGFLTLFEPGHSYTEEESFELSCHGSPEIVTAIVSAIVSLGGRAAEPGEFTERAFLNGRIDLTQAEAVRETIDAATAAQRRRAGFLREGRLADAVNAISETVGRVLASVEATTDFSEEIGDLDREAARGQLSDANHAIERLLEGRIAARLLRHGMRVAIVGRPNVGKSSLLNALLGMERAIVTDVPGTTRDTIEETVSIGGFPVVLTDTAGIRETDDHVERIGVQRSRSAIDGADQVWLVYEAPTGWTEVDELLKLSIQRQPDLLIANKGDLGGDGAQFTVSALTGDGLGQIAEHVKATFRADDADLPLINERHEEDLKLTVTQIEHARATLASDVPTDLACVDLYGALQTLGKITGKTAPAEILERIFRDFCIGK